MRGQEIMNQIRAWLNQNKDAEVWVVALIVIGAMIAIIFILALLNAAFLKLIKIIHKPSPQPNVKLEKQLERVTAMNAQLAPPKPTAAVDVAPLKVTRTTGTSQTPTQVTISTPDEAVAFIEQLGGRIGRNRTDQIILVFLNETRIQDVHLKVLQFMRNVESLHLRRTEITDACLSEISSLPNLKFLYLHDTHITDNGIQSLLSQRPHIHIER